MSDAERIVHAFFKDNQNIKRLFSFLTLEHKKGFDFFDVERFGMFKALFRNFGDMFLDDIRPELETMVADHRESVQRAAAELMASIIRGSKHWPYEKIDKLWSWLLPTIRVALNNVSPETQRDWGTCFATSSDNRDPNKLHWLMEVAMEEPIRSQGSFIDASRLYMLQSVVAQQRWRVGQLLHRLLDFLIPFLCKYHGWVDVLYKLSTRNVYTERILTIVCFLIFFVVSFADTGLSINKDFELIWTCSIL